MDVIYWLIPSMLFVGFMMVLALMYGVKSGQYDDLDGEGSRILSDEEIAPEDAMAPTSKW